MSVYPAAHSEVLSDDGHMRVWRWTFHTGQATGVHTHEFDYIAIPVTGGQFRAELPDGSTMDVLQVAGQPYSRGKGINHNIVFVGDGSAQFVEIELLDT